MNEYGQAVYEISDWLGSYREEGRASGWLSPEQELVIADLQREFDRNFMYVYADYSIKGVDLIPDNQGFSTEGTK